MNSETAKALALLPFAPFTLGTAHNDYCQAPEPHDVRAIFNTKGQDMLFITATSNLVVSFDETGNPARVGAAAVLSTLWTKSPDLLAALDGLLDYVDGLSTSGRFPAGELPMPWAYALRVRDELVKAMLAAPANPNPASDAASPNA